MFLDTKGQPKGFELNGFKHFTNLSDFNLFVNANFNLLLPIYAARNPAIKLVSRLQFKFLFKKIRFRIYTG